MIGFILLIMTSMALSLNFMENSLTAATVVSVIILSISVFYYRDKQIQVVSSEDEDYYFNYYQDL